MGITMLWTMGFGLYITGGAQRRRAFFAATRFVQTTFVGPDSRIAGGYKYQRAPLKQPRSLHQEECRLPNTTDMNRVF